jgi:hypothetical protein
MGADTDHDQPFRPHLLGGVGDARVVGLRIAQLGQRHRFGRLDLLRRAMADEQGLAAPVHGDRLADLHRLDVDLDRGQRQRIGGGVEIVDKGPGGGGDADGSEGARCDHEEVAPGRVAVPAGRYA